MSGFGRADMAEQIADMIVNARRHPLGITGIMLQNEINAGRQPVQPGASAPFGFPADDWHSPCVVSLDGDEVRLVAILATNPGSGALSRLVRNIQNAGLLPVVVEPVGSTMPAILKHWGWRRQIRGRGWERFEEWRPPTDRLNPAEAAGRAPNPSTRGRG